MDKARTLLLVEDEAIICMATSNRLKKWGYSILTANSGEQAVTLAASDTSIDLILMDIDLGLGLSGPEAAERILEFRNVPIVFLTSHAEQAIVDKVRGITRYGYVLKNTGDFVLRSSLDMAFELFNAHMELHKQLKRSNAILQSIPDMMFVVDREGYYRDFCANNSESSLALKSDEIIGSHLGSIFSPEEVEIQLSEYKRCLESGEVQTFSYELDIHDERRSFEVRIAKQDDDHILAIVRDITERKKAENDLRKLPHAIKQSPAAVVITDKGGNIEYVNPKFEALTGYSLDMVIGKNPRILKSGHTSDEEYRTLWSDISSGKEWEGLFYNKKRNGEYYYESAKIAPVLGVDGKVEHFIAVKEDITSFMLVKEALAESEARFRTIAELSPILIWESDTNAECMFFNSRWLEYTGRTLEQEIGRGWTEGVHPEDLDRVHQIFTKAYEDLREFNMKYRLRKADGSYGWITDKGSPKYSKDGIFTGYIGYCTEI